MKLTEIRNKFLDYFRRNGHEIVKSSSLIPEGDPTLLFTNAGMNQFKDVFLGVEKRSYSRAATAQKCFRASGKHNDLENVGRTARHHTFFEMLGNFSFGDYFKKDAIRFAWEFMTVDMALPKDKLWITVYQEDDEAHELWKEVPDVSPDRILRMDEKENFWSMGDTGPCGPCSEIHIDQGEELGCGRPDCGIECECDRYLELWNLVFMQYNRDENGELTPLPRPSIDTGLGIERIAAVKQGVYNNYDIDHFQDIIRTITELTGKKYGEDPHNDVSLRVIADHARAMAFLIGDGILPANEGRGYVLRRVMRRAGRHAKMLGKSEPVLYKVANKVGDLMGEAYPELLDKRTFIAEVIKKEEERFLETLDAGLKILQEEIGKIESEGRKTTTISGELAFKLYDTYGFPVDLTRNIAEDEGLAVDQQGFEKEMQKQRERARVHWKGSGESTVDEVYKKIKADHGETEFTGYDTLSDSGRVIALIAEGKPVDRVSGPGAKFELITDKTPFYGESGGQVGDRGKVEADNASATVHDTTRPIENLFVHHCELLQGSLQTGEPVSLEVDEDRRRDTARNHSATHLLQAALRQVVGDHVHQKGSLVTPDRLRFDLTHFSPLSSDELRKLEDLVNQWIRENHPVNVDVVSHKEALQRGATALFGEKYGEVVRMIEIDGFSCELCGGTHTGRTGDIGLFKIMSESGVSAGVRRIEAVTGRAAVAELHRLEDKIQKTAECLRADPAEIEDRAVKLQEEIKSLKKELKVERERKLKSSDADILDGVKQVNGIKVLAAEVQVSNPKDLRTLGDEIKNRLKSGVAVLGARHQKKAHLLAVVTDDLTDKIKAGDLVKELAPMVGGKGGGRADFAQAGGPEPDNLEQALARVEELVSRKP
ncbi:MAG: alanine--tRNA ligase [bacterium]